MAKINNVGFNLNQKIANPFRTSRNSTTNPFKSSNFEGSILSNANPFEGNTLLLNADVLENVSNKKVSRLKMISSSVAGSMNKIRSNIAEPIVNFVRRVRENVSNAWDYAKNTNISDVAGIKNIRESWNNVMNKDVTELRNEIKQSLSNRLHSFNENITDFNKNLSERWNGVISRLNKNNNNSIKITKYTPVADIRAIWERENALMAGSEVV